MSTKNGSGTIRVLVVAASAVRRAGLEALVKSAPRLKLVGSTPLASGVSAQAARFSPTSLSRTWTGPTRNSLRRFPPGRGWQ